MLYSFTKQAQLLPLPAIDGLEIRENDNPLMMSVVGQISMEEATRRLANDHKAYVAYLHNVPAAFGWMAMGKASIGELNHELILPLNHRYLWNFRTLPAFRGQGIYPHLLQYIITDEQHRADCFWIMHAPENKASQRGILKAGFHFIGKVSVTHASSVILETENQIMRQNDVPDTLGFSKSNDLQATCWNCSSPYLAHRKTACCCQPDRIECNQDLFLHV